MTHIVAAADIGGSHITVGWVDLDKKLVAENSAVRLKVDSKSDRETILGTWVRAFELLAEQTGHKIDKMAFAMPGPFDYENGISLMKNVDKYDSIYEVNVRDFFAHHFRISASSIVFRNDAEAFLHGEVTLGHYGDQDRVLGFTLGTGFGSAYSTAGDTVDLVLGLNPYKDSMVDDYLTTRWFQKRSKELLGERLDVKSLLSKMDEGNEKAMQIFDEFAQCFFDVIVPVVKEYQADYIILGGNIAKAYKHFLPKVYQLLTIQNLKVNIKLGALGEFAAMAGSAVSFQTKPSLS